MEMDWASSLPEGCVADILSLTSPRDVCRLSAISWRFKSAADSDTIWEKFLPSDYREIISRSASPVVFPSKKQLYFHLCDSPMLIDGGKLSFAVDKQSGKNVTCYQPGSFGLYGEIIHTTGLGSLYLNQGLPTSLSMYLFSEVAHLVKVCWFDIGGRINTQMLSPETSYAAYFVFKIAEQNDGLEFVPMQASVRLSGEIEDKTIYLKLKTTGDENAALGPLPRMRMDGWMEIELGNFFNDGEHNREVEMRLMEVEHLNWKSGLIVEGMELRPKVDA